MIVPYGVKYRVEMPFKWRMRRDVAWVVYRAEVMPGARGVLVGAVIIFLVHLYIKAIRPDFPVPLDVMVLVCLSGVPLFAMAGLPIFFSQMKITDEGIPGTTPKGEVLHRWEEMEAFELEESHLVRGATVLVLHLRSGKKGGIVLPDGELAERVVAYVADRVPPLKEVSESTALTTTPSASLPVEPSRTAYVYLVVLLLLFSGVVGYLLGRSIPAGKDWMGWVLFGTFLFGPGTIWALTFYRWKLLRKTHAPVFTVVFMFNITALVLVMGVAVLMWFAQLNAPAG